MPYTVNKMAKLSGVSVRTLHWYDKIDLLKPAFIGNNGYRYYEDEQLFTLIYEILFYKDLGLTLTEIKEIIYKAGNEKIKAMMSRKKALIDDIQLKSNLLMSLEKTLQHIETMSALDCETPHDFDTNRQREYEFFLITNKNYTIARLNQVQANRAQLTLTALNNLKQASIRHYQFMKKMLIEKIEPTDTRVQNSIKQHFLMIEKFYNIDLNSYSELPNFFIKRRKVIDMHNYFHPRLNHYIKNAIAVFSNKSSELCHLNS